MSKHAPVVFHHMLEVQTDEFTHPAGKEGALKDFAGPDNNRNSFIA